MRYVDNFFGLFSHSPSLFITILLLSAIIYSIIFKKYIYSIFDPFLFVIISLCFGTADVLFMHVMGAIRPYYLWNYLLTQTLFIIGFLVVRPIRIKYIENKLLFFESNHKKIQLLVLYYGASVIFVATQIATFVYVGIPIFLESRLMLFVKSGGFGLLGRMNQVFLSITIFLLIDRTFSWKKQHATAMIYDLLLSLFIIVSIFLGGSKSALLNVIYLMFFYVFFFCRFVEYSSVVPKLKKFQNRFFILALIGAIGVISVEMMNVAEVSRVNPLIALGMRFILSGDIYMSAYQESSLEMIEWANPLKVMFSDFLGMYRIVPWEDLPKQLGLQLFQLYVDSDLVKGPNPIHNVFGLFYFGYWGSLLYSFFIGFLLSCIRNKLLFVMPKSKMGGLMFMLISQPIIGSCMDISLTMSKLNNVLLIGVPLILFSIVSGRMLAVISSSQKKKSQTRDSYSNC